MKKTYTTPKLSQLGNIGQLTQGGSGKNSSGGSINLSGGKKD